MLKAILLYFLWLAVFLTGIQQLAVADNLLLETPAKSTALTLPPGGKSVLWSTHSFPAPDSAPIPADKQLDINSLLATLTQEQHTFLSLLVASDGVIILNDETAPNTLQQLAGNGAVTLHFPKHQFFVSENNLSFIFQETGLKPFSPETFGFALVGQITTTDDETPPSGSPKESTRAGSKAKKKKSPARSYHSPEDELDSDLPPGAPASGDANTETSVTDPSRYHLQVIIKNPGEEKKYYEVEAADQEARDWFDNRLRCSFRNCPFSCAEDPVHAVHWNNIHCQGIFCRNCLNQVLGDNSVCGMRCDRCKQKLTQVESISALHSHAQELEQDKMALKIRCPHSPSRHRSAQASIGPAPAPCDEVMPLSQLPAHLKNCPGELHVCRICQMPGPLNHKCRERAVTCEECSTEHRFCDTDKHENSPRHSINVVLNHARQHDDSALSYHFQRTAELASHGLTTSGSLLTLISRSDAQRIMTPTLGQNLSRLLATIYNNRFLRTTTSTSLATGMGAGLYMMSAGYPTLLAGTFYGLATSLCTAINGTMPLTRIPANITSALARGFYTLATAPFHPRNLPDNIRHTLAPFREEIHAAISLTGYNPNSVERSPRETSSQAIRQTVQFWINPVRLKPLYPSSR